MENTEKKSLAESFINGLKNTVVELEELRVQAALGKAEAKEMYEEAKKKLSASVHEAKHQFSEMKNNEQVLKLVNAFEFLQVQLALGKAETEEAFESQYKKIVTALKNLEENFKSDLKDNAHFAQLHLELEKFKIKLQLMTLHYKLNMIKAEYNFEQKKTEFFQKLDELKVKMLDKEAVLKNKWDHLSDEIAEGYSHLKNIFTN